ncbi:hypothetical protein BFP70_17965 [Thioclava sp. SK-1]|nr:hypothetical protein BFP70_17965 [Thioclava sp. SK-1]
MNREAPATHSDWLQVDSYKARIEPVDASKVALLHELTVSVFWPHRVHDLELIVEQGRGFVALDEINRPLSSVMQFPHGDDFAMLGMMVTTPRLQSYGSGSRLLRRVMQDNLGKDMRLSATRSGYRLYESAGFVPVGRVWQHQGLVRPIRPPTAAENVVVRPMQAADRAAIHGLDLGAYGAARTGLLDRLIALSECVVAERDGVICGFAMLRQFGKGQVIGPLVADDDALAMQLCAPFLQQSEGRFVRFDLAVQSERFAAFLAAAGLGSYDTVTEMRFGRLRRAMSGAQTYGLASQSLG